MEQPIMSNKCLSCETEYPSLEPGDISCPEGHMFCRETQCSGSFLALIFSEPYAYFPGKCPICKSLFPYEQLEKLMDELKKALFLEFQAKFGQDKELSPVKSLETILTEMTALSIEDRLEEIKGLVEEIIERESQVFCPDPDCKAGGRKDLNCNHITCDSCSNRYCYVCGKSEQEVDKADPEYGDIFSHNEEWTLKEDRCPLYFYQVCDIDERYPCEESEALNLFHKLKIEKALQSLFKEVNDEEVREMEEKYEILKKYEISIEDVLKKDAVIIIKR